MFAKWIPTDGRFLFSLTDNGGVELTQNQHADLTEGQSSGKRIVADANGHPILQDLPITPLSIPAVSPWQIRKALNQAGLRAAVEAAVAQGSQEVKDGWEVATEFRRTDPLVEQLGAALGKTAAELDAIFQLAATL